MTEPLVATDDDQHSPAEIYAGSRGPRAPRIGPSDVFQAADALLLEGHRPTIDRIRMRIGRGSPNTIQEHLDRWWLKLGSRLKDIPGQEIPGVPGDVAAALVGLWNTAVANAYTSLGNRATSRDEELQQREDALVERETAVDERERISSSRADSMEVALELARNQLSSEEKRADRLEATLATRDADIGRLRDRAEAMAEDTRQARAKLDAAVTLNQAEREKQDERHAASEAHWMVEVDRARQSLKEASREHDRQLKEIRGQLTQVQGQRDEFQRDAQSAATELRTANKAKATLEKRVATLTAQAAKRLTVAKRGTKKRGGLAVSAKQVAFFPRG